MVVVGDYAGVIEKVVQKSQGGMHLCSTLFKNNSLFFTTCTWCQGNGLLEDSWDTDTVQAKSLHAQVFVWFVQKQSLGQRLAVRLLHKKPSVDPQTNHGISPHFSRWSWSSPINQWIKILLATRRMSWFHWRRGWDFVPKVRLNWWRILKSCFEVSWRLKVDGSFDDFKLGVSEGPVLWNPAHGCFGFTKTPKIGLVFAFKHMDYSNISLNLEIW